MIYILDTADLAAIKHCNEFYPLAGVTTNPSIIAKAKCDFWKLVKEIRAIIGEEKMLHVQTTQTEADKIVEARLVDHPRGMGYCHAYWPERAKVLMSKFGVEWRSPARMNPRVIFD